MADNIFDQFDVAPVATKTPVAADALVNTSANVFDQFDSPSRQNVQAELKRNYALSQVPGEAIKNVPASYLEQLKGLYNVITSPIETAKTLGSAIAGAQLKTLTPESVKQISDFMGNEASVKQAIETANAFGGFYKDRLGSYENIKRTIAEDPVGFLGDLSTLFSAGAGSAKLLGSAAKISNVGAVSNLGQKIESGGKALSTAAAYTNPLAPLGTALEFTGKVAKVPLQYGFNIVEPVLPGGSANIKSRAYAQALNNDPAKIDSAIQMLQNGSTIEQVSVALNSSGLASFAETAQDASTVIRDLYNARALTEKTNQLNTLAGVTGNLNALNQANLPLSNVSPNAPRRAVNQAVSAETQALEAQKLARTNQRTAEQQAAQDSLDASRAKVVSGVANKSQLDLGNELATANANILKNTRETVTQPAYEQAFKSSPKASINVSNLGLTAKGQLTDLLTELKGLAPNAAALLENYGPKTQLLDMGNGVTVKVPVDPKLITLEDAHKIRQAINMDRAALKGSTEASANTARLRLNDLYNEVNMSIKAGVSPEAFKLFETANDLFKERIVNVFRTGQPANLNRTSTLNQPMLLPEDIVPTILKSEGSAKDFIKVYGQDPNALKIIATGIEDLYRQDVLSPGATTNKHAAFMFKNEKQLAALDQAGINISARLNKIGSDLGKLDVSETALTAAKKDLPAKIKIEFAAQDEALKLVSNTLNFKNTNDLRAKVATDPMAMDMALKRMDAPAKASLARGMLKDAAADLSAGKPNGGAKMLAYLTDNEANIMTALKAADPKTATKTFADAKQIADIYRLVEETGNKLSATPGVTNSLVTAKNIDRLTKDIPELRAVVDDLQKQIQQGVDFEKLAAQGKTAKGGADKLLTQQIGSTPNVFFNKIATIANIVITRLKGKIDAKLSVEIAKELLTSENAATTFTKSQDLLSKIEDKVISKEARAKIINSRNFLALDQLMESQNQNALAQ